MPGIFAEIELVRHTTLVEASVVDVETKMYELDFESDTTHKPDRAESQIKKEEKRTTWLDLAYLRNSLITWQLQIGKMSTCAKEFTASARLSPFGGAWSGYRIINDELKAVSSLSDNKCEEDNSRLVFADHDTSHDFGFCSPDSELTFLNQLNCVGQKIKERLDTIQEEYGEKIRDCTMRVDGMAMATKWASASVQTVSVMLLINAVTQRNGC